MQQKICNNMYEYAYSFICKYAVMCIICTYMQSKIYAKYDLKMCKKNMQKNAKNVQEICIDPTSIDLKKNVCKNMQKRRKICRIEKFVQCAEICTPHFAGANEQVTSHSNLNSS